LNSRDGEKQELAGKIRVILVQGIHPVIARCCVTMNYFRILFIVIASILAAASSHFFAAASTLEAAASALLAAASALLAAELACCAAAVHVSLGGSGCFAAQPMFTIPSSATAAIPVAILP
jgi:hypothetical protein